MQYLENIPVRRYGKVMDVVKKIKVTIFKDIHYIKNEIKKRLEGLKEILYFV